MISEHGRPQIWAYLLVAGGLFLLAGNLGLLGWVGDWLWALLFLAGGAGFLYYYRTAPQHWWALIPGFALAAIGTAILLGDRGGPLFLALLGVGFALVYLTGIQRWWAVIPAGVLVTLGGVAWVDENLALRDSGWVFFLGLALTFGVLYLLPEGNGKQHWALYPALVLAAFSLLLLMSGAVTEIVVPLLLVAVGVFLLWRRGTRPTPPDKGV